MTTALPDTAWALDQIRALLPAYGRDLTLFAIPAVNDPRFGTGQEEQRATVRAFVQPVGGGAMRFNRGIQDSTTKQYRLYALDPGLETDTYFRFQQDAGITLGTGDETRLRIIETLYLHGIYVATAEAAN